MKKILLFLPLFILCIYATAQHPTDFYVDLSKSTAGDSIHIAVSVPFHVNIGYEVIKVEIKAQGADTVATFQLSSRFPKGVVNNLNMYVFAIPFKATDGVVYEVTIQNPKICNMGPFNITEEFSNINKHTFSYANPGYKLTSSIKQKKS